MRWVMVGGGGRLRCLEISTVCEKKIIICNLSFFLANLLANCSVVFVRRSLKENTSEEWHPVSGGWCGVVGWLGRELANVVENWLGIIFLQLHFYISSLTWTKNIKLKIGQKFSNCCTIAKFAACYVVNAWCKFRKFPSIIVSCTLIAIKSPFRQSKLFLFHKTKLG